MSGPVFYDPAGKRPRQVKRWAYALAIFIGFLSTIFVISLVAVPLLPSVPGFNQGGKRKMRIRLPNVDLRRAQFQLDKERKLLRDEIKFVAPSATPKPADRIVGAFYAPWQETGLYSLRANASRLTHLYPVWLHLDHTGHTLDFRDFDFEITPHNREVLKIARENGVRVVPVLNNAFDGSFHPEAVANLLKDGAAQDALVKQLTDWLVKNQFAGLNLDFEDLADADKPLLTEFLMRLRIAFARHGLELSLDLESGDLDRAPEFAAATDYIVPMAYDEHWQTGPPGAIASLSWTQELINELVRRIPPNKIVLGVGSYAYDWTEGQKEAESISYQGAISLAAGYRDDAKPEDVIDFDPVAHNATFDYDDDHEHSHTVWMLDGPSCFNQVHAASAAHLRGVGLWVMGLEDPSVWTFLNGNTSAAVAEGLEQVHFPYDVDFEGQGEILYVKREPRDGSRMISVDDSTGFIKDSSYVQYPSSYLIERRGYRPKTIALTFDDGPDGTYTDPILDVLKENNVPATFFVIGENAESHPGLVRRMYDEGHEVGSHSFTHPNLGAVSDRRIELELNTTQRAIQSILGRSTLLFRPPYNADAEPVSAEEVHPIEVASRLGYLMVGELIDPQDWNLETEPDGRPKRRDGHDVAQTLLTELTANPGNVVLMHDGGGNRQATVDALREILPILKERGYKFVPVSSLAGLTRDQVMPPLAAKDRILIGVDKVVFTTVFFLESVLAYGFLFAIVLGLLRLLTTLPLAAIHRRRQSHWIADPTFRPEVSVLVAAFNEAKVIANTIASISRSKYPLAEIIVVDDGSTDGTADAARALNLPNVRVITQENAGKASALNNAHHIARGEIVVCVDADTQLDPDAIDWLVRPFSRPNIAAVAGNVKVGNRGNLITQWQSIEYITSQNLDRHAYAAMNAITVVPGAIGAWRRTAVEAVGGYQTDTLAEDMDLTWRLRRAGYRLENESRAIAYTEAPDSMSAFFKQRFRWAYGTLQCLVKHRSALGRCGLFGWVALPILWMFQIVFQVLAPLIDLQILYSIGTASWSWISAGLHKGDWQPQSSVTGQLSQVAFLYGLFFALELMVGFVAYRWDRERPTNLWLLLFQRIVYRQVMYGVVWKSLVSAIRGVRTGWGKLDRKASVTTKP